MRFRVVWSFKSRSTRNARSMPSLDACSENIRRDGWLTHAESTSRLKLAPLGKLMRKRLPSDVFVTHAHHDDAAARTLVLADQLELIQAANFLMRASTHTASAGIGGGHHVQVDVKFLTLRPFQRGYGNSVASYLSHPPCVGFRTPSLQPLRSSGAPKVSIQDTTSPVSDVSRGVLLLFRVLS